MRRLWLIALALVATACSGDTCNTPFGDGADIDIYQTGFSALANPGGTATVNRGHRGIVVRCESLGNYVAFELTCPLDHDMQMVPDERDFAMSVRCPRCGSQFELINGNPCTGAATACPLYRYETTFHDGHYILIW